MESDFFKVLYSNDQTGPRIGLINTGSCMTETPCFLPVASNGSFRSLTFDQAAKTGSRIIMINAWHVYNHIGEEKFKKEGGIHNVLNWNNIICTDSGGYQVFSLRENSRITDDGVVFGTAENEILTPYKVIKMQKIIGSNIIFCLDDCAPYPCNWQRAHKAVERTIQWGHESIKAHKQIPSLYGYSQYLFGITQGSTYNDLRIRSSRETGALDFDGFGIGGLSIGMKQKIITKMTRLTCEYLPDNKPRHLLGAGLPLQILLGIANGVDTFDCVLPIRKAQRGVAFTSFGEVVYKSLQTNKLKSSPLDPKCSCSTCTSYSREDLRQLYRTDRDKTSELASIHNLYFYNKMLEDSREAIRQNRFTQFYNDFFSRWKAGGGSIPL